MALSEKAKEEVINLKIWLSNATKSGVYYVKARRWQEIHSRGVYYNQGAYPSYV